MKVIGKSAAPVRKTSSDANATDDTADRMISVIGHLQ
jgi:hypothetical protein